VGTLPHIFQVPANLLKAVGAKIGQFSSAYLWEQRKGLIFFVFFAVLLTFGLLLLTVLACFADQ